MNSLGLLAALLTQLKSNTLSRYHLTSGHPDFQSHMVHTTRGSTILDLFGGNIIGEALRERLICAYNAPIPPS